MVLVKAPPPALAPDILSLFYTTDDLLDGSPILVFYGPSATTTAIPTNSRIQVHIYSPAGFQSYPRLTVSPSSPLYTAVTCLAREEQGDEICRALAFSLFKHFAELPPNVKEEWGRHSNTIGKLPSAPDLFTEAHAAMVASRMVKVENIAQVISDVTEALAEQSLSWIDVDVVLPPGSMKRLGDNPRESNLFDVAEDDITAQRYGDYAPFVRLLGQSAFLPTSRLRRAPSRPVSMNRSLSFSRKQKENLRREMVELLDTEENYVSKLYDLVHSVAEDFREKARKKNADSSSPSIEALKSLFPSSLDQILEANSKFLDVVRAVLDNTEDAAIKDLENTTDDPNQLHHTAQADQEDVTGAVALAKCLLEWFPQFADCYTHYIQAHADFSRLLRIFMKETGSSFSKRVQDTGEQRLMSMLIEPVQRLPRYNLYIDNIVKQLPVRHPALKPLLKARDIISEICSRDSLLTSQQLKTMDNLRRQTAGWPSEFHPQGRFITAVDVVELSPPYQPIITAYGSTPGILLLFSDYLVMLQKVNRSSISARSLMSDSENSKLSELPGSSHHPELVFSRHIKLGDVYINEVSGGRAIQVVWSDEATSPSQRQYILPLHLQRFYLSGAYDGKAAKFVEDFVKARIEGRFSESERESYKWEVRNISGELGMWSAIFEEANSEPLPGRREPAPVRIVVDPQKGSKVIPAGSETVEVAVTLTLLGKDLFGLEVIGLNDYVTRDQLTSVEFLPVLSKRLGNFLQLQNQIKNPSLTAALIMRNQQILKAISVRLEGQEDVPAIDRGFRPASPVKILSNLFGGSVKELGSPRKTLRPAAVLSEAPRLMPTPSSRPQSSDTDLSRPSSAKGTIGHNSEYSALASLAKLEETFAGYILALHARKGNVVGRSVRGRASADELAVNELYNALLEDPANHQIAAQSPVDVLFAAFEKFLKVAWKEKMGPVITQPTLVSIQLKSDNSYPGDFEEYFHKVFGDLSPQNQRALQAITKLLADLLDGTGNDSDRGILTAAFAEVLVEDGNPHEFISLLDRFVEDVDALFLTRPPSSSLSATPHGSLNSESRARFANTGSLNSNTSSLRKRLGFGSLSRENSKLEHESKLGSILRTLSKNNHGTDSQPSSITRGSSLNRSRSTDIDVRLSPRRPGSRDRPTVLGAFTSEEDLSHSGFSHLKASGLDTIGEVPNHIRGPLRKKRRSSLSDLQDLRQNTEQGNQAWSPQTPRTPARHQRQSSASPRTPSPPKPSSIPTPSAANTAPTAKASSPPKKENTTAIHSGSQRLRGSLKSPISITRPDEVTITGYSTTRRRTRGESVSGIPLLKSATTASNVSGALSERPSAGNAARTPTTGPSSSAKANVPTPTSSNSPTKKLRMQSPQKLRERLQKEQKAIATANSSLQSELAKIGDEITKLQTPNSTGINKLSKSQTLHSSSPSKRTPISHISQHTTTPSTSSSNLAARLASLELHISTTLSGLQKSISQIEHDVSSSLQVSETRARKLDDLYREANAENEALYGKFNEELSRVLNKVRAGEGGEELKKQVREKGDEISVLKREIARLRRENVGLRAQLRD